MQDDKYWILGSEFDDFENAYEYNLETGEYFNPVPKDMLPSRTFEADGSRWELFNDRWIPQPEDPTPEDRWRRVDIESGKTVGEYDFGEYLPEFVADGYLWLSRKIDENRSELARLPLG